VRLLLTEEFQAAMKWVKKLEEINQQTARTMEEIKERAKRCSEKAKQDGAGNQASGEYNEDLAFRGLF